MPPPTNIAEFVDLARKSGVLDEKRLESHIEKLRQANTLPPEPNKLAGVLVRDGLLTMFQAEQLVQGKWRRFTIGRYKVLERLGQGGMGSVYLCEHILMRRRVAVKILPTGKSEDQSAIERFHREARVVAALDHPNIVRAYDADEADGLHFLVMEHVDGASFQDLIKKTGPMDVLRVCHYMRQAALGLQHAHDKAGIVHRDIKPANILIDRTGTVKILDMGLARFFHDDQDALTRKYDENVLGTADYLSPEQAEDSHTVDIRTDLYSLGGTFYYCLTGQPPFAEGTVAQKLIWHQTRQPKPIASYRNDVPEGVIQIINTMMAKNREQRYPLPQDVADALEPFTQTPIGPPPESEMPQLSPAAMGVSYTANGNGDSGVPPSAKSKTWQVSSSAASRPTPVEPATKPSSKPPGNATPSTQPPAILPPPRTASKPAIPVPPPTLPPKSAPVKTVQPPARPVPPPTAPSSPRVAGTPMLQAAPLPPQPAPVVEPSAADENEIGWEQLEGDTSDATQRLDTAPPSARRRAARGLAINQEKEAAAQRRKLLSLIGVIGGCVAIGLIVVFSLVAFRNPTSAPQTSTPASTQPQTQTYVVGKTGDHRSINEILPRLRPGDKILIRGPEFEEQLFNPKGAERLNGVTIEGENGLVIWKRPASVRKEYIVYLVNAKNVKFKGFLFDGVGQTESLVGMTGACEGVTFENIQMRGATVTGFRFVSCDASKDAPVTLRDLSMENTTVPPLVFEQGVSKKKNTYIHLESATFTGPGAQVVLFPESIGSGVTFPANVKQQQR